MILMFQLSDTATQRFVVFPPKYLVGDRQARTPNYGSQIYLKVELWLTACVYMFKRIFIKL